MIGWLNVTCNSEIVFAGPIRVSLMILGGPVTTGGGGGTTGVQPTAAPALTRPPPIALPLSTGSLVAVFTTSVMTCWAVQLGCSLQTRSITPLTNGVAIDVPVLRL